jgi:hypothetical protein
MERKNKRKSFLSARGEKKNRKMSKLAADVAPQKESVDVSKVKNDFFEVLAYQTKRENLLLGEFSADGKYSLNDEKIIAALVEMPKIFQEKVDNVVYAYAKKNGISLNFKIVLDESESYCTAEMFLVEVESSIEEDIKHLTSLGEIVEVYSPKFRDDVYKQWNIHLEEVTRDKDGSKESSLSGGDYVFDYLKVLEGQISFNRELIEILSQLYVVRLLKLLDNCGDLGVRIQVDYKLLIEKLIKNDPSLAQNYTKLKKILDKVIAKNNGFDTILKTPGGTEILENFYQPIDRIRGGVAPTIVEAAQDKTESAAAKKAAKKEDSQPKKKSKPKAKAAGGASKPKAASVKKADKPKSLGSVPYVAVPLKQFEEEKKPKTIVKESPSKNLNVNNKNKDIISDEDMFEQAEKWRDNFVEFLEEKFEIENIGEKASEQKFDSLKGKAEIEKFGDDASEKMFDIDKEKGL